MREVQLGTPRLPQICGEQIFQDGLDSECMIRGVIRGLTHVKDNCSAYPALSSDSRRAPGTA
jgi:hypothetical protein